MFEQEATIPKELFEERLFPVILLMVEILHQLIGSFSHYLLRATAHAADPSNSEEEVKEEAMHG